MSRCSTSFGVSTTANVKRYKKSSDDLPKVVYTIRSILPLAPHSDMMQNNFTLLTYGLSVAVLVLLYCVLRRKSPKPGSPTKVPYLIPWLGHALEFNNDALLFLKKCQHKYGSVYKVLLAGKVIVILASADGIANMERDVGKLELTNTAFLKMMKIVGDINENSDYVYEVTSRNLTPIVLRTLAPQCLVRATGTINRAIFLELRGISNTNSPVLISLSDLIARSLYSVVAITLFGPTYPADTYEDFQTFNNHLSKLVTGLPLVGRTAKRARERLIAKLLKYIEPWWNADEPEVEGVSEFIFEFITEMKTSRMTKKEAAGILLYCIWGIHANTWFMLFWLMANITVDEDMKKRICQEVRARPLASYDDPPDDTAQNYPLVHSGISESLRWSTVFTVFHEATRDVELMVDGRVVSIEKGEQIMGDVRSLHHNSATYPDPAKFKVDRYLLSENNKVELPKPLAWGGGKHMCPGRHFALYKMQQFMVSCFQLYDISAVSADGGPARLPRPNHRDLIGALRSSEDFIVKLSPRVI